MAREIIKENKVAAPTLFIGVGGTGCDVVRRVAEMCRPGETENISFVCLDTNVNDLSSVKNSKAAIYYIQTSSTQTVGDYLTYDEDAMAHWFPKNAVLYDKTVSEGAGQVRAISRLAFNATVKTGRIKPLYDAIDDLYRKDGGDLKQAVRVCIVSTASGGTGSGIILPLSMFVRDYINNQYPNSSVIIRALIMLPETLNSVIDSTQERESQRRNAYATVKEINAFMMKGSGFCSVNGALERFSSLHLDYPVTGSDTLRSLSLLPMDFCFLMDGQNAEDNTLVSFEQYKVQAAQALYEQNIGPMQRQAFSIEDNIIKELSNPGNFGRNRFGGIGSSILRYPYEMIADYIAADWALDAIGGDGEAAKWSRYDKEYERKRQEAEKKGAATTEIPTRGEVYTEAMRSGKDNFSKDMQGKGIGQGGKEADRRVRSFMNALESHMHQVIMDHPAIGGAANAANELADKVDYGNTSKRGHATDNLDLLRTLEVAVQQSAANAARNGAEAVFYSEGKTVNSTEPYALEAILRNGLGEVIHPNAMRFMLYLLTGEVQKRIRTLSSELTDDILPRLELYHSDAAEPGSFDVKSTRKAHESSIDEMCEAERDPDKSNFITEKFGGTDQYYAKLNEYFPDYYEAIIRKGDIEASVEAYRILFAYLQDLNKELEKFYASFPEKVKALSRSKTEIVDSLAFKKGDSVLNICAEESMLQEMTAANKSAGSKGALLDSDLNASFFDAVKNNVAFVRETRFADIVEEDSRIDLFDEILSQYFKDQVRENCESIDLNIIQAIAMEYRLRERRRIREEQQDDSAQVIDKVSQVDAERYITKLIRMGQLLAAPGIQRMRNEEPREVKLVAYNQSLLDMTNYRMNDLVPNGKAVDTISRYELHFFNALYNLTPDKLSKFACYTEGETGAKSAGLYHNAYVQYEKNIGPDSTKNMMISTHIDKRWDSVAVMPELDLDFQARQVMKIHQAMIYGLIHRAIRHDALSSVSESKKVYKFETSDEHIVDLTVSNGTLCDEFYEILDAIYISPDMVEDIELIARRKRARDQVRNSNYEDTNFKSDRDEFCIEENHKGETSLFEIPLSYYNSLPNSQRYSDEIAALVEAVIKTYADELNIWENPTDAKFILCAILEKEFRLLMANYKKYPKLSNKIEARNNKVIDLIYRKIRHIIGTTPEPDDYEETMRELRGLIQE